MTSIFNLLVPMSAVLLAYYLGTRASYIKLRHERQIDTLNETRARAHEINAYLRIIRDTDTEEPRSTETSEKLNDDLIELMTFVRKNRYWLQVEDCQIVNEFVEQAIGVGKNVLNDQGYGDWFSNLMFIDAKEKATEANFDSQLAKLDKRAECLTRSDAFPNLTNFLVILVDNLPGSRALQKRIEEEKKRSS